ncbi:MAG: hypothetical protein NUV93_03550 [Firmicutes bacterium]|jgi:hypothetical protein|nr:hypothetical protein [Bacillota bacterium]
MKSTTISWTVIAVGAAVSAVGYSLLPANFGAGVLGFGLAHIVLGALDLLRPQIRQ